MNKQLNIQVFVIIMMASMFVACKKDDKIQAEDSLEGVWDIVAISSMYGEFFENGFNPSETVAETAQLGIFHFMEDSVEYSFTRNDTLYTGIGPWDLELEKVQEGFSKSNRFTLTIEDHFLFDVSLGNGTRNAEKNARNATFVESPSSGFGVLIEISLEKK